MNTNRQKPSEFPTRDLYLAVVIKLSGVPIARVENQSGRGIFVFRNTPKIEEIVSAYFNDELTMNPKAVFETWKSLKSMAYSAIGDVR